MSFTSCWKELLVFFPQWLRGLPSSRQSFSVIFGDCPYCSKVGVSMSRSGFPVISPEKAGCFPVVPNNMRTLHVLQPITVKMAAHKSWPRATQPGRVHSPDHLPHVAVSDVKVPLWSHDCTLHLAVLWVWSMLGWIYIFIISVRKSRAQGSNFQTFCNSEHFSKAQHQ